MKPARWLISDIDGTLTGDPAALATLSAFLEDAAGSFGFGVATGRSPELTEEAVREFSLPQPDLRICAVGSQVIGQGIAAGTGRGEWPGEQAATWDRERIRALLERLPDLELQPPQGQGPFKVSYHATDEAAHMAAGMLADAGIRANVIHSAGRYLDILPDGVSKGSAVRFVAAQLGADLQDIIVAGDTGNDADLLTCGARAILVGNHGPEVAHLRQHPLVYAADASHAAGVIEGLRHYGIWNG